MDNWEKADEEREGSPTTMGDCFPVAYGIVTGSKIAAAPVLVHGVVTGQPGTPIDGVRHWHAWVEYTITQDLPYKDPDTGETVTIPVEFAICIDNSQGKEMSLPLGAYYNLGRIDPEQTWRYSREDAYKEVARHLHYGPWVETPEGVR